MVPALELHDVSKSWGPVKALKSVSLTLKTSPSSRLSDRTLLMCIVSKAVMVT